MPLLSISHPLPSPFIQTYRDQQLIPPFCVVLHHFGIGTLNVFIAIYFWIVTYFAIKSETFLVVRNLLFVIDGKKKWAQFLSTSCKRIRFTEILYVENQVSPLKWAK